jgi:hypothetical protein
MKDANQKYLSQLKTKFLRGMLGANHAVEENIQEVIVPLDVNFRQSVSPKYTSRNSKGLLYHTNSTPVKDLSKKDLEVNHQNGK